jgi:ribonuclease P protein component
VSGTGLAPAERIRRRPEFERVYNEGARISGRFMTVFLLQTGGPGPRLGVAATRKMGNAVERNRAKRLAREIFRRHKITAGYDIVIVPRREMLDAPFATLEADYDRALERRGTARSGPRPGRPGNSGRRGGRRPRAAQGV